MIRTVCTRMVGDSIDYVCRPFAGLWFECGKCMHGLVKAQFDEECPRCGARVSRVDLVDSPENATAK